MNRCVVCGKNFKKGDYFQAFLRCPEDPNGSWTNKALIDNKFQERALKNNDNIKRKHSQCVDKTPINLEKFEEKILYLKDKCFYRGDRMIEMYQYIKDLGEDYWWISTEDFDEWFDEDGIPK